MQQQNKKGGKNEHKKVIPRNLRHKQKPKTQKMTGLEKLNIIQQRQLKRKILYINAQQNLARRRWLTLDIKKVALQNQIQKLELQRTMQTEVTKKC